MKPIRLDMKRWQARNIVRRRGRLGVRPGLRKVAALGGAPVGGRTVRVPATDETRHYIVDASGSVALYNDLFSSLGSLTVGTPSIRTASFAVFGQEVVIASPDMPTLHSALGSGVEIARRRASVNTATTAIDIPRGITTSWAGRAVIADRAAIYISDALEPRTFVGQNLTFIESAMPVYGIHTGAEGALLAVTGDGVFALPEDAAAVGQQAIAAWSRLTDHLALDYDTTCIHAGVLWGLTERGVRPLYPLGPEMELSEDVIASRLNERLHLNDWREARLMAWSRGPLVSARGRAWLYDVAESYGSWWLLCDTDESPLDVVAVLTGGRGEDLLLCVDGNVWKIGGNFDGDVALHATNGSVLGELIGRFAGDPDETFVARTIITRSQALEAPASHGVNVEAVQGSALAAATDNVLVSDGTPTWADTDEVMDVRAQLHRSFYDVRTAEAELLVSETGAGSEIADAATLVAIIAERPEQTE